MGIASTPADVAAAGNQDAFMELVEPEMRGAYRLAVAILRNPSEAEDAVQDAVLSAWRHFGRFRRDAGIRPWFFRIVVNECRSRRRSRWWSVIRGWPPEGDDVPAPGGGIDASSADLRRALRRLPRDQRLAIVLRYYLDLPFEEVADTLGISPKAARSRIYRALERLRVTPEVSPDE